MVHVTRVFDIVWPNQVFFYAGPEDMKNKNSLLCTQRNKAALNGREKKKLKNVRRALLQLALKQLKKKKKDESRIINIGDITAEGEISSASPGCPHKILKEG